jgi:hypothetical protein
LPITMSNVPASASAANSGAARSGTITLARAD